MSKTIGLSANFLTDKHKRKISETASAVGYNVIELDKENRYERIADCEILFGFISPARLKLATRLEWLNCHFAGVELFTDINLYANRDVVLTNASGAYGVTISEHLVAVTLMMLRHLSKFVLAQERHEWESTPPVRSIYDSKITVIGMGDIGSKYAKIVDAMGAHVTGVRKNLKEMPNFFERQFSSGDIELAIVDADVVVLALPSTSETINIMSRERISKLQPHTILINIGRGSAIDQDALCEALNSGKLGGAALDVMIPEPLPADHPLWTAKNCLITPHISGNMSLEYTCNIIVEMFIENIKLYAQGQPLNHVVDMTMGY